MPRNSLIDLNNHLFETLERLNDHDLNDEQLKSEIERSKAVNEVAKTIVLNARVSLDAAEIQLEYYGRKDPETVVPEYLLDHSEKQ